MLGKMPVVSLVDTLQLPPKMVDGLRLARPKVSQTQVSVRPSGVFDGCVQNTGQAEVVNVRSLPLVVPAPFTAFTRK